MSSDTKTYWEWRVRGVRKRDGGDWYGSWRLAYPDDTAWMNRTKFDVKQYDGANDDVRMELRQVTYGPTIHVDRSK